MIGFTAIPVGLILPALVMYWVGTFYRQPVRIYGSAGVSGGGRRYPDGDCPAVLFPTDRTLFVCGCACRRFVVLCHVYTVHNSEGHRTDLAGKAATIIRFRQIRAIIMNM